MATFEQIKEVRLKINDPFGFINIIQVTSLPVNPAFQTLYQLTTDSVYYSTSVETAQVSDYEKEELYISDSIIATNIDAKGILYACCQGLKSILSTIGRQFGIIKSNSGGAESTEYTDLSQLYSYYKNLYDLCNEDLRSSNNNNTGKFGQTKQPTIAGGNL